MESVPWRSVVMLDVSRLLYRGFYARFSGIDRVELAYAQNLLRRSSVPLEFVAANYRGGVTRLPKRAASEFVAMIAETWLRGPSRARFRSLMLLARSVLSTSVRERKEDTRPAIYLNVSGHPLSHPWAVRRFLASNHARFVPLIHDLIPIDHPEFVPPSWTGYHIQRLEMARRHAAGIIVASRAVADSVRGLLPPSIPLVIAPLGVAAAPASVITKRHASPPYFVCLGTIEPRKNHLMLLQLWRRLVQELGDQTPKLVIIGRRGWENEQVVDMLDRCKDLRHHVEERSDLADAQVRELLRGARALIMPSFIEGYGLPVVEALAEGTPVICSAIPALREVGKGVPEYLDPLDFNAWSAAVMDYTEHDSPRRMRQMARLSNWKAPSWDCHFDTTLRFLDSLGQVPEPAPMFTLPVRARRRANA